MTKNRSLVAILAIIVLSLATSVVGAQGSTALPLGSSVTINSDAGHLGTLSISEGVCVWTFALNSNNISLVSEQPFSVLAANKGPTTLTTVGDVVNADPRTGFGQVGYTMRLGNMPMSANLVDSAIFVSGSQIDILSGANAVAHLVIGNGQCAVVPANALVNTVLDSNMPFAVNAAMYDAVTATISVQSSVYESEDVGTYGAPAFQLVIGNLPTATNVNAIVLGASAPVLVTATPQFGVPATATPAFGAPTATPVPAQGGGVTPGAVVQPMVYPAAGQWVFQNFASTNTMAAGWQAELLRRGGLHPQQWVNNVPNADNPAVGFVASQHGMEVPSGDHTYGEAYNTVSVYSAGRSIRSISADYDMPALGVSCHAQDGIGCLLIIVNVNDNAVTFENQTVKNGWSNEGAYFNGNELGTTIWAAASYSVAHMVNLPGAGPSDTNQGSNCSSANGCENGVLVTVVEHSAGYVEWIGTFLYQN